MTWHWKLGQWEHQSCWSSIYTSHSNLWGENRRKMSVLTRSSLLCFNFHHSYYSVLHTIIARKGLCWGFLQDWPRLYQVNIREIKRRHNLFMISMQMARDEVGRDLQTLHIPGWLPALQQADQTGPVPGEDPGRLAGFHSISRKLTHFDFPIKMG